VLRLDVPPTLLARADKAIEQDLYCCTASPLLAPSGLSFFAFMYSSGSEDANMGPLVSFPD